MLICFYVSLACLLPIKEPQNVCDCESQNMSVSAGRLVQLININYMYSKKCKYLFNNNFFVFKIVIVCYLDCIVGRCDLSLPIWSCITCHKIMET